MARENRSSGFPTRCDANPTVQSQTKARSLKVWIQVEEELYYPFSENKGAGQLCIVLGKLPLSSLKQKGRLVTKRKTSFT